MERKSLLWSCQGGGEGQDLDLCGENIYGQPREGAHRQDGQGGRQPHLHALAAPSSQAGVQQGQYWLSRKGCRQHQYFPE